MQAFRLRAVGNVVLKGTPLLVVLAPAAVPFHVRAEHLLCATVVAHLASAGLLLAGLGKAARPGRPDRELVSSMWRYVGPALVGVPATTLIAWADPLILSRFVPAESVGHYQLAYMVVTVCAVCAASLNSVISPEIVRADARGDVAVREEYATRWQPAMAIVLSACAFVAAAVAPPVVRFALGQAYAPSAELMGLLLVAGGLQLATATLSPIITAASCQRAAQIRNVAQAASNVGLDLALGSAFGATGIAVANIGASAVGLVTAHVLMRRAAPLRSAPMIAIVAAALAVAALALAGGSVAMRTVVAVAVAATFAALAGGALDLRAIGNFLRRRAARRPAPDRAGAGYES
jgi:O-antigen/teichoic acid export membrane protein